VRADAGADPSIAARIGRLIGSEIRAIDPVRGGDVCTAYRLRLADGRMAFTKSRRGSPPGFFAVEAHGLKRLAAVDDGVRVPDVLAYDDRCLVLDWVETGQPTAQAAEELGRALARTHRAGPQAFGSSAGDGWIANLPLPGGPWSEWPELWAEGRVRPFLRAAVDRHAVNAHDARDVERVLTALPELAGPSERPALVHGDLWAGNVLWSADGVARLVDPAVHGGHRETDLAMLALFGLPHLERLLAGYQEQWPLAAGWQTRIALHQLHPVLVHAVLFGGSYGAQAGQLARAALRAE
jgi:fructosamine-3-kinase